MYDIIVVGGGPAGMTAALYARRNAKTVLVIEKNGFGGQITHSPKVENYPAFATISGNELAERMLNQILEQGADIEFETVCEVKEEGDLKVVLTEDGGRYEARAIILATGVKHRMLGLPGETELVGEGVSYCAVCDGDFFTDQVVCMAGGGNSALQEALLLAQNCKKVIILQDLPQLTGEVKLQEALAIKDNVEIHTSQTITALVQENGALTGVETHHKETGEVTVYPCSGLFVSIGLIPENEPFKELAALNAYGYFDTDEQCLTHTAGIYVAGDCRSKNVRQLTTATADGATAALAACRYLNELG